MPPWLPDAAAATKLQPKVLRPDLFVPFAADAFEASKVPSPAYMIGVGKADITGPAAGLGMMGYGELGQKTAGVHTHLYARAFSVAHAKEKQKRVTFVSVELGQMSNDLKREVISRLQKRWPERGYDATNVLISATHTHSGPGGYAHYHLNNASSFGGSPRNVEVIVSGIVSAIAQAQASEQPGHIRRNEGSLTGVQVNRSRQAYAKNADAHSYSSDTNQRMSLLRFDAADGKPLGEIDWYGVHGTSISNDNHLVSSDNKGIASLAFERAMNAKGHPGFVAAAAQADSGDVSPNVRGDVDGDGEWEGEGGTNELLSAEIAGRKQYEKARVLFDSASTLVQGPVDVRHKYIKMTDHPVGDVGRTARRAGMGFNFVAGTEDGFGPRFVDEEGKGWGSIATGFIRFCQNVRAFFAGDNGQGNKAVFLPNDIAGVKLNLFPDVVPIQLVRIGDVAVVGLPGEPTTMAGRRIRAALLEELAALGVSEIVISGLANEYSGYITTQEEYSAQNYEGASTLYGPLTLDAYIEELRGLARAMRTGAPTPSTVTPPDRRGFFLRNADPKLPSFDRALGGRKLGDILTQPKTSYVRGGIVEAEALGGHPSRALSADFVCVQKREGSAWKTVVDDADPSTVFRWRDVHDASVLKLSWETSKETPPGEYRLVHRGRWRMNAKQVDEKYEIATRSFVLR